MTQAQPERDGSDLALHVHLALGGAAAGIAVSPSRAAAAGTRAPPKGSRAGYCAKPVSGEESVPPRWRGRRHAMTTTARISLVCAAMTIATACASKPKTPVGVDNSASSASVASAAAARKVTADARALRSVPAHLIATVSEKSIGPFIARRGSVAMAAYIGTGADGSRRVVSVPLGADGDTRGDARVVAPTTADATTLVLRPTGGSAAGFLAAWTALTDRGEALTVVGIGDDGVPRGAPTELARSVDDVVWVDVVPTPRGAICVWAEETRGGDANVLAVALDPDGKMRGVPSRIARNVTGWQVTATRDGAALALVSLDAAGKKKAHGGALTWLRLDSEAHPIGAAIPVTAKPSASGDVDVVRLGDRFLLAWTDRVGNDPELAVSTITDDGKVETPRHPLDPMSGSSLVALAAGRAGAVIAWDEPSKRGRATRQVHLAHLDANGALDGRNVALEVQGRGVPEVVATDSGFAVVASARVCEKAGATTDSKGAGGPAVSARDSAPDSETCSEAGAPTFLRTDANLVVVQTEPLLLGEDREAASMAWGLGCAAERCTVLTATGAPARIQSVDLPSRVSLYAAPVLALPPADAPRIGMVTTLASGEPFADLAVATVAGATLVATVTSALDGASGSLAPKKGEKEGATLAIRVLDAKGALQATPSVLSTRALSIGGVAIAAGGAPDDGAAVAWVARESGDPQVHVTRIDRRGKRTNDVQLTTAKGDAADVAIAWSAGGWIVSWVDWRNGNGEVYATKIGTDLARTAREERITDAPGDASDVTLFAKGDALWLAWADPRESPKDGFADIYVAELGGRDAKRKTDEVRLLASAAHSRSPSLAPSGEGLVVAWIEEAPLGADAASSVAHGAMLATLDARGHLREPPLKLRGAGDGFPTAITLDPFATGVRAVIARSTKEQMSFDTMELGGLPIPRTFPLFTLDGPPSMDVSMTLLDGVLYFNDDGPAPGDRRARRATISFKR